MEKQWHDRLMRDLFLKLGTYTPGNQITEDSNIIRSAFAITEGSDDVVLAQACLFEYREGVPQLEIYMIVKSNLQRKAEQELKEFCNHFNYQSACGAMGVDEQENELFLRECMLINPSRNTDSIIEEIIVLYEMMMNSIREVYSEITRF